MFNRTPSRILTSGRLAGIQEGADLVRQGSMQGTMPIVQKAVVMEVICKPDEISYEYKEILKGLVNNPELIEVMTPNTVIARPITSGQGLINSQDTILMPFFSSHIMLPIQPGEVVFVMYEDATNFGNKLGYWMTRPHGNRSTEDVNYTHTDRMYDARNDIANWSTGDREKLKACAPPGFPNGGGYSGTETLALIDGKNPYDVFAGKSQAGKLITPEPVPRWNKRPQEFVIQGSNNTLIMLGEDRVGHVSGSIDSSVNGTNTITDIKGHSGTIDIIAGRGRFIPKAENRHNADPAREGQTNPSIAPDDSVIGDFGKFKKASRVIQNTRGNFETDKAPFRQKASNNTRLKDNPKEGDPDFENDAARILVTMQSNVDTNFALNAINYPDNVKTIIQPEAKTTSEVDNNFNKSYVVGKGDHVRLIARRSTDPEIKGTILLLREGIKGSEDSIVYNGDKATTSQDRELAYIFLNEEGNIQIQAKKIYVGPSIDEKEPYILHSKFEKAIQDIHSQILDSAQTQAEATMQLRGAIEQILNIISTSCQSANITPTVGSPHPSVAAIGVALPILLNTLLNSSIFQTHFTNKLNQLAQNQSENETNNVAKDKHSEIIFGG